LRYALDSNKIKALGWVPQNSYEQAMQRTVDWYVHNEQWWRRIKDGEDFQDYYGRNYGTR
jgi:dTDP-glucose 4,6-dehydratase